MKRILSRSVLGGLLFASYLVVVSAYLCQPVKAQSGHKTEAKNSEGSKSAKEFQFEIVSIRPLDPKSATIGGGPTRDGYRVALGISDLIKLGYSPYDGPPDPGKTGDSTTVINPPNWGYYQINARVAEKDFAAWQAQDKSQELLRSAMRAILKDRFQLVLHEQQTKIPVYNLVVSRKGIQFKPSVPGSVLPAYYKFPDGGVSTLLPREQGQPARFYNATIADLIWLMRIGMDRPIIDGTGLVGHYDFSVYHMNDVEPESRYELRKLGLELKAGTGRGLNLIVDHIEKPSPN